MLSNTDVQNGDSVGTTSVVVSVVSSGDVVSLNVVASVSVSPVMLVELELEELDELEELVELDDELDSSHCSVPMGRMSDIANKYSRADIISSFRRRNARQKKGLS